MLVKAGVWLFLKICIIGIISVKQANSWYQEKPKDGRKAATKQALNRLLNLAFLG